VCTNLNGLLLFLILISKGGEKAKTLCPSQLTCTSLYKEVQVNCDGQRVFAFSPPLEIKIKRSDRPFKLVHTSLSSYFGTLRTKLHWGIDLRSNISKNQGDI
jgi:hypothetical protein